MLSTGPERQEVVQAPREFVATVCIDGLKQTAGDPEVHGQDVKVLGAEGPDNWDYDCACAEDHGLNRRGVFSGKTKRSRVLMVDLVNVLVERTPVKEAVRPVMPCILYDEEYCDLKSHSGPCWERDAGVHATGLGHWVEQPDLR